MAGSIIVELLTKRLLTITPSPKVTVVPPTTKRAPNSETFSVAPRAPVLGLMSSRIGGGALIVKGCAPLVPGVVTVTVRAPTAAAASITKLAVSDVVLPTTTELTVTPAPLTATVVAPMKLYRQRDGHRGALSA